MATSISTLSLLLILSLAATTTARPCKTLFYFSATTTTTYYPYRHSLPANPNNPNPSFSISRNQSPRYLTLIFTSTRTQFPEQSSSISSSVSSSGDVSPLGFHTAVSSSIRDRTKDIMSVVGALLFGVGCGALTAATMYLLWALFSLRRGYDYDDVASSSDDEDDDDVAAIKRKLGYVSIPNDNKVVDGGVDDLKKPKEVV